MKTYEDALEELKDIIGRLEGGGLTLEQSLELFQDGVKRINFCYKKLEGIKKKVELLVEGSDGELEKRDYEPET
ncbi:MAG: exodeoxyribonuclease VII small subunit [Candidatus Dadabacteria bacterium]|nr:exodeoxyribonuclease VII small subunit [Candidatus Dadabacteria bacterium]